MSYDGQIDFGLVGDYDAMDDLDSFALDLEGAVAEIIAATPGAGADRDDGARTRTRNGAVPVQ
jgi:hypothetical protein